MFGELSTLVSRRRKLSEEGYAFLDKYYGQPVWKTVLALSYVKF
jgi:hypothetical protein